MNKDRIEMHQNKMTYLRFTNKNENERHHYNKTLK